MLCNAVQCSALQAKLKGIYPLWYSAHCCWHTTLHCTTLLCLPCNYHAQRRCTVYIGCWHTTPLQRHTTLLHRHMHGLNWRLEVRSAPAPSRFNSLLSCDGLYCTIQYVVSAYERSPKAGIHIGRAGQSWDPKKAGRAKCKRLALASPSQDHGLYWRLKVRSAPSSSIQLLQPQKFRRRRTNGWTNNGFLWFSFPTFNAKLTFK
jgi:hypothetical protein